MKMFILGLSVGIVLVIPITHILLGMIIKSRKGHWIKDEFGTKCSCCGKYAYRDKFDRPWESPFCPICGADMRGDTDD